MPYNVLVLSSSRLPTRAFERLNLGLPPRGAARRRDPHPSGSMICARLQGVTAARAAALRDAMVVAGGRASTLRDQRAAGRVVLLEGDDRSFDRLLRGVTRTIAGRTLAGEIRDALHHRTHPSAALRLRKGRLDLGGRTRIMGILNLTPDSFSDGGSFPDRSAALDHALRMVDEGADIIDVGGESTRPGAAPITVRDELRRVVPVLEELVPRLARRRGRRTLVSIDTTKAEVVRCAAQIGVDLVNDISGLGFDPAMPATIAQSGLPVVISHIRGTPRTMQRVPRYDYLLPEIAGFLRARILRAERAGIPRGKIVIDPGIGFGKRRSDNLAILRHLPALRSLGRPILVGASRKSFIGRTLELPVGDRLEGSLAAQALAIAGGADIIRVHDVRPAVRAAHLCDAVLRDAPQRDRS